MNVLIVFSNIPEDVMVYKVKMNDEEYSFFKKADGCYINASEDEDELESCNVISSAITSVIKDTSYYDSDVEREYAGKWVDKRHPGRDMSDIDWIIVCGFYF